MTKMINAIVQSICRHGYRYENILHEDGKVYRVFRCAKCNKIKRIRITSHKERSFAI